MNLYFKQFFFILSLMAIHVFTMCVTFIEWNWNLTALVRLVVPILGFSFLNPSLGMLIVDGLLDSFEPNISRENIGYHIRDKIFDTWGHFVGLIAMWLVPLMKPYRVLLTFLFFFRFTGTTLFLQTSQKKYLAYFPNYYSMLYIALPFLDQLQKVRPFSNVWRYIFLATIIILKAIVEYFHHNSKKSKEIKSMRGNMRIFCSGKQEMYRKTGTFPVDKKRKKEPVPIFKF